MTITATGALAAECNRLREENRRLREERKRLALAVCGGEDVPGLANSLSVEALEGVAANNRSDSISTINELLRAEAALTTARAETAAMVELAALRTGPDENNEIAAAIRALTPADAAAALEARERAAKAEWMREAALVVKPGMTVTQMERAILARAAEIEKGADQ